MNIEARTYRSDDVLAMTNIWNQVVTDGIAFPQEDSLTNGKAGSFFASQTHTGVVVDTDSYEIVGLYILNER